MSVQERLRYRISSLDQLPRCLSNKSQKLRITYTKYLNSSILCGEKVAVVHEDLGVLFSYVKGAAGTLVDIDYQMNTEELLKHLRMYGFDIIYHPAKHLEAEQLDYLKTLDGLKFDKLRRLSLHGRGDVFAFVTQHLPKWIHNTYLPTAYEIKQALIQGHAINISSISETNNYDWSWLDYVANIPDIIDDNE